MARPYSIDLRNRVVAAVDVDGLSRHAAAERYNVVRQHPGPGQMGGHKPKKLVGMHRDWLIKRCNSGDFTLRPPSAP